MQRCLVILSMLLALAVEVSAQTDSDITATAEGEKIEQTVDTIIAEALQKKVKVKRDWATWKPSPKKATWLALIPGCGQIYNRKYWKLPIVYGGFMGCIYAWRWNGMMYRDYSKAYMDIMDDDDTTNSYEQFLHLGSQINESNIGRYKDRFRRQKDFFRRNRDLSIFCFIGVYALSIIDAYVDASLSEFDISDDLSLRVEPAVINSNGMSSVTHNNILHSAALGLNCSLSF